MKPNNGKMPVLAVIAMLALVATFAAGVGSSLDADEPIGAQKQPASSSSSASDKSSSAKKQGRSRAAENTDPAKESPEQQWGTVKGNLVDDCFLGGWWRMEGADGRFATLDHANSDLVFRVYGADGAAQYGYNSIGESAFDSMDPLFTLIVDNPFGNTDATETTFTLSDGSRYTWREADLDTLALVGEGGSLGIFTGDLVRIGSASVPAGLKMAVVRADYDEQINRFALSDIADATYVDGLQILSGTVRVASESELFNEKFHIESSGSDSDASSGLHNDSIAELALDSPTFVEGEHASGYGMVIEAIQTIGLTGGETDWLSLDGSYITIAVSAEDVGHPSDVQPCDAWAYDAELW